MRICWDNLEGFYLTKFGNFRKYNGVVWEICTCKECGEEFLGQKGKSQKFCNKKCQFIGKNNPFYGKKHTKETLEKIIKRGSENGKWTGGYYKKKIPRYDVFADKISYAEPVRRNQGDPNILEVKCTYCGKWFIPKVHDIQNRIRALNGYKYTRGELRLYCSDGCKQNCSTYYRVNWERGYQPLTSREVQPELRKIVFARDGYQCVKCGNELSLHCHHIDPVANNPIESADVDNCITLCKECHKEVHKLPGCGYNDIINCYK